MLLFSIPDPIFPVQMSKEKIAVWLRETICVCVCTRAWVWVWVSVQGTSVVECKHTTHLTFLQVLQCFIHHDWHCIKLFFQQHSSEVRT